MSQLGYWYDERTLNFQTASAAYIDVTSPFVSAGDVAVGVPHLVIARGEVHRNVLGGTPGGVRMMHGTTTFDGSELLLVNDVNATEKGNTLYAFMTVHTPVAGEDLRFQIKGDGTNTTGIRFLSLLLLPLDPNAGLVQNTDWFFDERTTDDLLTTTAQTGASLTWTPGTGAERWLVFANATLETDTADSDTYESRLDRTGEATANWAYAIAGRAAGLTNHYPHLWIGTLGAVAQTFREQSRRIGTTAATAIRRRSAIFALRIQKFDVREFVLTDSKVDLLDTPLFGSQVATLAPTQLVAGGAALLLGSFVYEATSDNGQRYVQGRVQVGQADAFTGYTTEDYRLFYPATGVPGQHIPYLHMSVIPSRAAGGVVVDLDASVALASAGRGAKFRRLLYLSLDVAPPSTPPGGGGTDTPDWNGQIMYQNDYDATRRRLKVRLRDATDHVTPESGEAGGVGQISKNGGGFASSPALVAEDAANGLYYVALSQANLDTLGSLQYKYKSANTDLFTIVVPVEELPWVWDGALTSAGANTFTLANPPASIPAGSVIRIVAGLGLGESQVVGSYASPTGSLESGATWGTTPNSTSRAVILPGLPPNVPDVNVAQINGSIAAAIGLALGAALIQGFSVVAGTNTTTQITCNLPTVVNGIATPANFWANRGAIGSSGPTAGDEVLITGSVVSGANTILTVSVLTQAPTVGSAFTLT